MNEKADRMAPRTIFISGELRAIFPSISLLTEPMTLVHPGSDIIKPNMEVIRANIMPEVNRVKFSLYQA